ncbi:hypothetical protein KUCAC02_013071, partial [Chaenocephalus aceratus]
TGGPSRPTHPFSQWTQNRDHQHSPINCFHQRPRVSDLCQDESQPLTALKALRETATTSTHNCQLVHSKFRSEQQTFTDCISVKASVTLLLLFLRHCERPGPAGRSSCPPLPLNSPSSHYRLSSSE